MSTIKKIVLSLIGVLSVFLGTAYFLGVAFFQTHFKIGTEINGFQCSFKSINETEALLERGAESYAMAINTRNNGVEKISASDVGMTFTGRTDLIKIMENQNYKLWFIPETKPINLPSGCYQIDEEKMTAELEKLKCMTDMVKGESAHVVETDGVYQVAPSIKGTELDKEKARNLIETAIRQWKKEVNLEDSECYIDAGYVDEKTLQENCDLLNSISDTIITYDFGDRKETIDIDVITENFLDENYAISINKIKEYISNIAKKYDSVGVNREFVTYDDRKIPIGGGDYGWEIDIDKTSEELIDLIKAKTVDVVEPEYKQKAVSRNSNDIGHSYLEIDKEKEHAVLYVEGNPVVETKIYAGNDIKPGFYKIKEKTNQAIAFGPSNGSIYVYDATSGSGFSGTDDISGLAFNGAEPECIAIEPSEMNKVFETMQEQWPIIIY